MSVARLSSPSSDGFAGQALGPFMELDRFTTPRLTAERLAEKHLPDLLRMDKDARVLDPLGGVRTDEETKAYFDHNVRHWNEHGFGVWMLRLRADGSFVGRAYLRHLDIEGNDEIAVGYALLPEYWGKGLATEIAGEIVNLAFSHFGLESVVIGTRTDNRRSQRVIEKLGGRLAFETVYKNSPHYFFRITIVD